MNILLLSNSIPIQDRSGGWRRFFNLIKVLTRFHTVTLHAIRNDWQYERYGREAVEDAKRSLTDLGVVLTSGKHSDLPTTIKENFFPLAIIEHYTVVSVVLDIIRRASPQTIIAVDTIDIEYKRLENKARLTGLPADAASAREARRRELGIYGKADAVIAVSSAEMDLLSENLPATQIESVPLIFEQRELSPCPSRSRTNLLYVADFAHDANIDGITHFCKQVLPRIDLPNLKLRIAGGSPTASVLALANDSVEVMGFVPDLERLYAKSDVAIAPMRYGGGLKGKIAEALSFGVPVASNLVSLEGFDLVHGESVMAGGTNDEFAHAVRNLLSDTQLYEKVRVNGWNYVNAHFSEAAMMNAIPGIIERLASLKPRRPSIKKWLYWTAEDFLNRNILWRFNK